MEEYLNLLMEFDGDGIFLLDAEGKFIGTNNKLTQITGISKDELLQMSIWSLCSPQDQDKVSILFQESLSGASQKFNVNFKTANKGSVVLEIFLAAPSTESGVKKIFGIAKDLTDLRRAERALETSAKRFAALVQQGSDIISILDSEGVFTCVSENSFSILGLKPEHFIDRVFFAFIHPEDKENLQREFEDLKATGEQKQQVFRIKNATGSWRWMEAKAMDLRDEPSVKGIVVNSRDITENFTAKKALEESEQKYRAFFENSLDGILLTAPTGEIYAANPAACEMFQRTEEEICRVGREGIVDSADPRVIEALRLRRLNGCVKSEMTYIRKDGSKFPAEVTSSIYKNLNDEERSCIIIRDVTRQKEVEDQLRKSTETYKSLFEFSPLPNWIYDNETLNITDVNQAAITHYGYSREEFLKLRATDLKPEKERLNFRSLRKNQKNQTGAARYGKVKHLTRSGEIKTKDILAYKFSETNKTLVVSQDLTEWEKVQEELKEKSKKLLTAQKIGRLGYWRLEFEENSLYWTDEVYNIWERNKHEFELGVHTFEETVHPEDLDRVKKEQELCFSGKKEMDIEHRIILPDGRIRWVHEKGQVLVDASGERIGFEGSVQDVTEYKAVIEKLQVSEARQASLLQSQTNYLIRTDLNGDYSYCNQKFFNDFSWIFPDNRVLGKCAFATFKEYHHEKVKDIFDKCIANPNKVYQVEIDKVQRNDRVKPTLWEFICLVNSFGEPIEVQGVGIDITERIKTEQLLLESNERYEMVSKATSDAIYDFDCRTGKIFWSEGYNMLIGVPEPSPTPDNLDPWINAVHPEDCAVVSQLDAALRGTQNYWEAEYRFRRANGEYAHVLERGSIVRDEHNNAIRMVGTLSDISEKKKLQALLDKASRLARIGSFERDFLTDELYWSPVTREILEIPHDKVIDAESAINYFKEGEHRKRIEEAFFLAVEKNIPFDVESLVVTEKGKECWVRSIGQPEFLDGKCIRLNGSFQEIDNIKRAQQEAIKASEERESILESIGDAFFTLDHDWVVTYWNSEAERILQCSKEVIVGRKLRDFFNIKNTPFENHYRKAVEENEIQHFEAFFEDTQSWYEVNAYPSADGLSVFFKDVTDVKDTNHKLKELNNSLKTYTEELVTANKGLEQFSYIISHNLRAPVANILGLANLLEEDYPEDVKKEVLGGIVNNVKRLDKVMFDLNHILQVKNEFSEKRESIHLQELVLSIQSSLENIIEKEQVRIELDLFECEEITSVPGYIYSIFYNLIFNAIKYRRAEVRPLIRISTAIKEDKIQIIFEDNGMGIDLEKRKDQIFGLYKRFHDHVEGKGIGLFMVKTQVEMLGGRISVSSVVDEGTSFTIELKRSEAKKKEEKNEAVHSN